MDIKKLTSKTLKVIMWLVIAVVTVVLLAAALVYFNQDKIKSILVKELNASLTTEIKVKQIDVTFLSTFPNVALAFNDVLACDAYEGETSSDTLFFFRRLYLSFDLFDIMKNNYTIRKIKAEDGEFNMKIRKDGKENYIFWKKNDKTPSQNFNLRLRAVELSNTTYTFRNDFTHQYFNLRVIKSYANGNFYAAHQTIRLNAETVLQAVQTDNLMIASNLPLYLDLSCENDTKDGKIELTKGKIQTGEMKFEAGGYLTYSSENFIDMTIAGRKISIKQLVSLLPKNVSGIFKDYVSNGNLVFKSCVKGKINKQNVPAIDADFTILNGNLANKKLGITLSQINLAGKYSNGKGNKNTAARLEISRFSARFCEGSLQGSLILQDFSKLNLAAKLKADLELGNLQKMLQIKKINSINGNLKCDIEARGSLKHVSEFAKQITFGGMADITNLNLKIKDLDYALSKTNGSFEFSNRSINVLKLNGMLDNYPLAFTGSILNPFHLPSVSGNVHLTAFGGDIGGRIAFTNETKNGYRLLGGLNISSVDASNAFKYFKNFSQTAITDANIKGKINATATFNIPFDDSLHVLKDKLSANVSYRLENGGLNNVLLMKKLSHFVEEQALENVKFATLESSLQIKDGNIYFEPLNVVSNALSFEFLGKHNMKNDSVDYKFAIKMSELASKKKKAKLKKEQQQFGTFEEDKNARLTLFVKVGGTMKKPEFSYDMKRNLQEAKQIMKEDRKNISEQIKKDLQINTEQQRQDKEQWQRQSKGEWIIQWEDSAKDTAAKKETEESPDLIIEW
ncbi:MAG: AsmA-like C-terminal region-containing protein [Bacteroidales bacterium]|jgi:hypothetical protein|nr:AsmA-like C-terminal region-containing protein [Bacteroidales bacterium]